MKVAGDRIVVNQADGRDARSEVPIVEPGRVTDYSCRFRAGWKATSWKGNHLCMRKSWVSMRVQMYSQIAFHLV